eukprot:5981499-Alexandrium_andersonii.AAC.1
MQCQHCPSQEGTLQHLLWECPAFADVRAREGLGFLPDVIGMPAELCRFGWAPKLALAAEGPLWEGTESPPIPPFPQLAERLGALPPPLRSSAVLGRIMRGPTPIISHPLVIPGLGSPPEETNIWTDGSVRWADSGFWMVGGAGLSVAPDLLLTAPPLGDGGVLEFVYQRGERSHELWVPVQGSVATSSRAEAAAAAIAMRFPAAVKVLSDSQHVVNRVCRWASAGPPDVVCSDEPLPTVQVGGREVLVLPPPFCLMADGDLWLSIARAMAVRGAGTTAAMKIKSHMSWAQAQEAQVERRDWEGNARADANAAHAVDATFGPFRDLVEALVTRRHALVQLVARVMKVQTSVLLAASAKNSRQRMNTLRTVGHKLVSLPALPQLE